MPRYFFDVQDGYPIVDDEGTVLDGADAIAATAMRTLFEVGQIEAARKNKVELCVTARDEAGAEVYRTKLTIRAGWRASAD